MHDPIFDPVYAYLLLSGGLFVAWLIRYGVRPEGARR